MARTTSLTPAQRRRRASIAANAGRRVRLAGAARRDTSPGTTWTRIALILNVIAAASNLGTATLHGLPTSPSPIAVVVIYAPPHGCAAPVLVPSNALPTRDAG
jgi:hypothetical protein